VGPWNVKRKSDISREPTSPEFPKLHDVSIFMPRIIQIKLAERRLEVLFSSPKNDPAAIICDQPDYKVNQLVLCSKSERAYLRRLTQNQWEQIHSRREEYGCTNVARKESINGSGLVTDGIVRDPMVRSDNKTGRRQHFILWL
jgi:hypothetical protein